MKYNALHARKTKNCDRFLVVLLQIDLGLMFHYAVTRTFSHMAREPVCHLSLTKVKHSPKRGRIEQTLMNPHCGCSVTLFVTVITIFVRSNSCKTKTF